MTEILMQCWFLIAVPIIADSVPCLADSRSNHVIQLCLYINRVCLLHCHRNDLLDAQSVKDDVANTTITATMQAGGIVSNHKAFANIPGQ